MYRSFWADLKRPIIGLSPMDGVTDAACRFIADKYGKPSVLMTEFTSVEGIVAGAYKLLYAFVYHKTTTPTVAQIFGADPECFYKVALVLCEMGFDGIDINMGCPDPHVAKKGGGAGLILQPKLAQQIIKETMRATTDWAEGKQLKDAHLKDTITGFVESFQKHFLIQPTRRIIPVSVKTRIGYEEIVTEAWIQNLLEMEPANISVHGRTLKQMYTGQSNWEEIAKAAAIAHKTETTLLGNGDIKTLNDALEKIKTYGLDGVLIGRATMGNPWIFQNKTVDIKTRLDTALEHAQKFMELTPDLHFLAIRKHLAWYCKGFEGASDVRTKLMKVTSLEEVEKIISNVVIVDGHVQN